LWAKSKPTNEKCTWAKSDYGQDLPVSYGQNIPVNYALLEWHHQECSKIYPKKYNVVDPFTRREIDDEDAKYKKIKISKDTFAITELWWTYAVIMKRPPSGSKDTEVCTSTT
jgi:hypothetical protein